MSDTTERFAKYGESIPVIQYVIDSLQAAQRYNPLDSVSPAAILWPDSDGQWKPIVDIIKTMLPHILVLGEYAPETKTGPAIWIRCVVDGSLPEILDVNENVPVIYMPNVSRQLLRAVEDCPEEIKPLVELQYRGITWLQRNGKDWTVESFLVSDDGGLGLDVARDKKTRQAMLNALQELATTPLTRLQGKHLEAEDFDNLMVEDTPRELLTWMNAPDVAREQWSADKWTAFCSQCKSNFELDPEADGPLVAGEKLGRRKGAWSAVWQRFSESPSLYSDIPGILRQAKPSELLFDREPWPDENETLENALREALAEVGKLDAATARNRIQELEKEHAERRGWVWSRLGESPLAQSLQHLHDLAKHTEHAVAGEKLSTIVEAYKSGGSRADAAVLDSISCLKKSNDSDAVTAAVHALYGTWLDDTCRNFQKVVADELKANPKLQLESTNANPGECLLFVDGLRYDIGSRLVERLKRESFTPEIDWRISPFPTVTATAKTAVSPVAGKLQGKQNCADFQPSLKEGASLTTDRFRKMLEEEGYRIIDSSETPGPLGDDARGWSEYGEFDTLGHKLQSKMAARVDEQIDLIADRVSELLEAGWRSVRIITDHGWLLLPGGLPVVKLPKYLTESRWSRCALVKESGHVDVPTAPWYWNSLDQVAFAPGCSCFVKGNEYAHGGISLQESIVPDIVVTSTSTVSGPALSIEDVQWLGLRCRLTTSGEGGAYYADIRTKVMDPESSVLSGKEKRPVDREGRAGLLVEDDSLIGIAAVIIVLDSSGDVVAKQSTTIGGEE